MRNVIRFTVVTCVVATSGRAFALEAWRDRRGLLFDVILGGASFKPDMIDRQNGFNLGARIGGGQSQALTFDLGVSHQWYDKAQNLLDVQLGANVFFSDWGRDEAPANSSPFLRLGAGMVHAEKKDMLDGKTAFAAAAGLGYEALFTGDLAGSFAITYEPAFFDKTVHRVMGTLAIHWY